jgi:hypothetical protein
MTDSLICLFRHSPDRWTFPKYPPPSPPSLLNRLFMLWCFCGAIYLLLKVARVCLFLWWLMRADYDFSETDLMMREAGETEDERVLRNWRETGLIENVVENGMMWLGRKFAKKWR